MMHLSEYMAANDLSDDDVADAIQRTRETISRIRRRKVRPDWETIERIKEFTGGKCTADDFVRLSREERAANNAHPKKRASRR